MAKTTKHQATKALRNQVAILEAELTIKEKTIQRMKEHQRALREALIEWNRWAGRMNSNLSR